LVNAKSGSVLHPIPTPHFLLDASASTSTMQSAPIGLGSGSSTSASRLGFLAGFISVGKFENLRLFGKSSRDRPNRGRVRL
jgi:hypothetical protein